MTTDPPRRRFDSDDIAKDLAARGFSVIADLIDPKHVADARAMMLDFLRAQGTFLGTDLSGSEIEWGWRVFNDARVRGKLYDLSQGISACHRLSFSEKPLAVCAKLGIKVPLLRHSTLRVDFPNDDKVLQGPHQDIRGVRAFRCINFWVPLQPVDPTSGGLTVYDHSLEAGAMRPSGLNDSGYQYIAKDQLKPYPPVVVTMQPGEGLVFDWRTVHESTPNRSKNARLTWVFRFDDGTDIDWLLKGEFSLQSFDIQTKPGQAVK